MTADEPAGDHPEASGSPVPATTGPGGSAASATTSPGGSPAPATTSPGGSPAPATTSPGAPPPQTTPGAPPPPRPEDMPFDVRRRPLGMLADTWEPSMITYVGGVLVLAAATLLLVGLVAWAGLLIAGIALLLVLERGRR